ncbi:MAG: serine hydrolase [Gemmatimonadaceae bacterium]
MATATGMSRVWRWRMTGLRLAAGFTVLSPALRAQETIGPDQRYAELASLMERYIGHEMKDKALPALSIALVDGDRIVWARGFGVEDPQRRTPATAQTVYRIGSVSKLFTDIGVMQLVERGVLDLDAPITRYLPDFRPRNVSGQAITLRQLMSHRSGLVREPPAGNYFETTQPTLARTVASLNRTALVYPPESRTKYSNAAIAVVGYTLERTQRQPFASYLRRAVLQPMGLTSASFEPDAALLPRLAKAQMWTRHGTTFDAPTFQLGMSPAGSMYATMPELARFMTVLFNGGTGPGGRVLTPETLEQMWTPQFAPAGASSGVGLGFVIGRMEGQRLVRHGGAIYGFATELVAMPETKLGVAVSTSKDFANSIAGRIALQALRFALAVRAGRELSPARVTAALTRDEALALAGTYGTGDRQLELTARDTSLYLTFARGEERARVRRLGGDTLVTDDEGNDGLIVRRVGDHLIVGRDSLRRNPTTNPPGEVPAQWRGLIGEYGWNHEVLYVYERNGRLTALIEWFAEYPLREVSTNEFAFPDYGLYAGEKLRFSRDPRGRATRVVAAEVVFGRRRIPGEDAAVFRIKPVKPVDVLRRDALASSPPQETGTFKPTDLVELVRLDSTILLDVRYATRDNFLSVPVYSQARAFLQRPAAEALVRAHRRLAAAGYGLMIHDGYRPWYVTKMFWDGTPEENHVFVADPSQGSRHNRGCAVDLTLYDLKTGKAIQMVGGYDEMSNRSYPDYPGGTSAQRARREILRQAMEAEGFRVYEAEWWHFDYQDWRSYRIGNQRFEEFGR